MLLKGERDIFCGSVGSFHLASSLVWTNNITCKRNKRKRNSSVKKPENSFQETFPMRTSLRDETDLIRPVATDTCLTAMWADTAIGVSKQCSQFACKTEWRCQHNLSATSNAYSPGEANFEALWNVTINVTSITVEVSKENVASTSMVGQKDQQVS
jgi:hypothetical protein